MSEVLPTNPPDPQDKPVNNLPENQCPAGDDCAYYEEVIGLRKDVVTDPLTGLFNLRYFGQALEQELERTQRTRISTVVMMIDLDHFKRVNDTFGHEAGNLVLKQTAGLVRESTRKLDIQCRYGGEEFVVILPTTELILAVHVANRLRECIENTPVFLDDDTAIHVTASIGLAIHSAESPLTVSQFIAAADEQLYRAKEQGRNQVCYVTPDIPETQVSGDEKDALSSMFGGQDDEYTSVIDSREKLESSHSTCSENDPEGDFVDDDGEQWIQ